MSNFKMIVLLSSFFAFSIFSSSSVLSGKLKSNPQKQEEITYYDLELKLYNSAKKYIRNNYTELKNDIEIPIKLETLVNTNFLYPIKDIYTKNNCNGYVLFTIKNKEKKYKPYLKCDGYKTNGYNNIYD